MEPSQSTKLGTKRSPSDEETGQAQEHPSKRLKISADRLQQDQKSPPAISGMLDGANKPETANTHTEANFAREGLQRSIVLALQHVGFDSASQEALESLTSTTESYLMTLGEHLKHFAESARRPTPTPTDFGHMLRKYNIPLSSLRSHQKRNPVAKEKLEPAYFDPLPITPQTDYFRTTPTVWLGDELDGNAEKKEKSWIPEGLPAFPSKHTYKFTPKEAAVVDTAKKRVEALAAAQKGEKALRTINRATKMSQQKELRDLAQKDPLSKERYDAWESMMKSMMPGKGGSLRDRQDIADHSVIVDSSMRFRRREVPRSSNRGPPGAIPSKG